MKADTIALILARIYILALFVLVINLIVIAIQYWIYTVFIAAIIAILGTSWILWQQTDHIKIDRFD